MYDVSLRRDAEERRARAEQVTGPSRPAEVNKPLSKLGWMWRIAYAAGMLGVGDLVADALAVDKWIGELMVAAVFGLAAVWCCDGTVAATSDSWRRWTVTTGGLEMAWPKRRGDAPIDDFDEPFFSLLINVADLAALAGGSLALVFAVGYGLSGRGVGVWGPDAAIAVGLALVDIGLRWWRRQRKVRQWRRYHPDESVARGR
jgi:hypothetical protein